MSPRWIRRIVLGTFAVGIAGMIVSSVRESTGGALTFGLLSAAAAVALILVTSVAPTAARGPRAVADLRAQVDVGPLGSSDHPAVAELFDAVLGGRLQARLGELVDVVALDGVGAWLDRRLVGAATYALSGEGAELAAIGVAEDVRGAGVGGLLVEAVATACLGAGARSVWLVTTNDNLDALRLYQRHGFRLVEVRARGVDEARHLKPTIPLRGRDGIPLHDELLLRRPLG